MPLAEMGHFDRSTVTILAFATNIGRIISDNFADSLVDFQPDFLYSLRHFLKNTLVY